MSTETPVEETTETNLAEQSAAAESQVKKYALGALGVGLIPIPMIDLVALASLQLKMLHSLASTYHVEFKSELGKSAIAGLMGGDYLCLLHQWRSVWQNLSPSLVKAYLR